MPVEGWRLWPHPDRRRHQPDLRWHHGEHRRLGGPHQRRPGLCWRDLWRPGQRVDIRGPWAGDEGHAPGAAHGWLGAALHRPPPPAADVKQSVRLPLTRAIEQTTSTCHSASEVCFGSGTVSHSSCFFLFLTASFPHSLSLVANHCLYLILILLVSPPSLASAKTLIYSNLFAGFLFSIHLKVSSSEFGFNLCASYLDCSIAQRSSSMCLCVKYQPLSNLSTYSISLYLWYACWGCSLFSLYVRSRAFVFLGLTLNVAAFSLCTRDTLTQWTTLLYIWLQSSAWEL